MSDHEIEGQDVKTAGDGGAAPTPGSRPAEAIHGVTINKTAELVLDLLSNTNLVPPDRLALVRGRAGPGGSFSQALVDEGIATSEGVARMLAARHQLPLVDLALTGVQEDAAKAIPTHVLERVVAIPYAADSETLHVAVADPLDVQALDQLRLATTLRIDVAVASRDDIAREIAKIAASQLDGGTKQLRTGDDPVAPAPGGEISASLGVTVNKTAELVADLLGSAGLVSADKLALVRGRAGPGGSIAQALVDEGVASSEGIARMFAARHELPLIDLTAAGVDDAAVAAISAHVLERVVAIPYQIEGDTLFVAVSDPSDLHGLDQLRLSTTHRVEIGVASRDDIASFLGSIVKAAETTTRRARVQLDEEAFAAEFEGAIESDTDLEAEDGVSDAPLVRLVNSVLFQAAEDGASDVHFEPQEDALVVRFRIDGVLQEVQRIPKRMIPGVVTRLKVLAKLDIAERRKPQDGRISLNAAAAGRTLDVRVATLPTVEGESIVMRLLDKSKRPPTLTELGLADHMREAMERIIRRPTGALLVTGPTGSGKSTTLFAALTEINRPELKIITVEDPVEYRVPGVNQVQINNRAGLTFAAALRSILRSDPDVVMVGEIRDGETAKISIEAALTGHFVLSTLHTNDAPGALTRLNEMGVEPFLTGAAVTGVLAQRLGRKLCSHCAEMYQPNQDEMIAARISPDVAAANDGMAFYRKRGCPRCNQTGYKGRIGIYQLLEMNEEIASLAASKGSREEIERAALGSGMKMLWDDGMAKVASGLTSIEELARVTV